MSTQTGESDPQDVVSRRLAAVDQPHADRVRRDVLGLPVSIQPRDYAFALFDAPGLVARWEATDATVWMQRHDERSAFQRARVRDGRVEVTDFGTTGAPAVLGRHVELLPADAVTVFDAPDTDERGMGGSR